MTTRERILQPYTRRVDDLRHRIVQLLIAFAVVLLAMVFGFFVGVFGIFGWQIPAVPILALASVALWIAPDVDTDVDRLIVRLYFIFMAILMIWPPYLAFNAPGLPWISPQRIGMFILAGVTAFALSTSKRLRTEFAAPLQSQRHLTALFIAWVVWTGVMLAAGAFKSTSLWSRRMVMWHFAFLISAWIASKPGNAKKMLTLFLVAITITAAVVLPEVHNMKPIWIDHIPVFMQVDEEYLQIIREGGIRFGAYRAKSIFGHPIIYAEYLGMTIPFTLLAISWARNPVYRIAACGLLLLLITAGTLTQARSAMAAMVATIPMFIGLWIWRRYRHSQNRSDLIAPAMFSAFPFAALMLAILVLVHPRVHAMVLGGSGTQNSTAARKAQWAMATPEIIKNPVGYGMGSISKVVPYHNLAGNFTIDSYPINLLVEHGVPGFLLFVGFFALAIAMGVRVYLDAKNDEELIAGAAAVGIAAFLIVRTILSSEGGQGLAFAYAGVILGLWFQQRKREQAALPESAITPDEAWHR